MPVALEIIPVPLGSQLVSGISGNDKADKNDFDVLFLLSENADLTQSGVSVSAGSSIVAFEGANSVYRATIRPPQTSGIVTVTVAANAVSQGNVETSKDIRVTRFFPDVDAEVPTLLFEHNLSYVWYRGDRGFIGTWNCVSRGPNYLEFFRESGESITVYGLSGVY